MKIISPYDVEDCPCPETHIEVRPREGIAIAPFRTEKCQTIKSLKEIIAERQQFDEQTRATVAALEDRHNEAAELQQEYEGRKATRASLQDTLKRAQDELDGHKARLEKIDSEIRHQWQCRETIADHVFELGWRQQLVDRLPKWIAQIKAELAAVQNQIAKFESEHGIGEE